MNYFVKIWMVFMAIAVFLPATAQETLTVCDGTTSNYYLPVYGQGYYIQTNQMIYPESMLEDMVGNNITSLKFYASRAMSSTGGSFNVSLGTTTQTAYETATAITDLTQVATGKAFESGNTEMFIEFDEPFLYTGDNLVIQFEVTSSASYGSSIFLGVNQEDYTGYYAVTSGYASSALQAFLPKATFTYESAVLDPYKAKVSPTSINFGKTTPNSTLTQEVTVKNAGANPFTPVVNGLEAPFSTTYTATEIANGETVTIPIVFTPTTDGNFTATIQVTDADGNITPVEITLSGACANEVTIFEDATQTSYNVPFFRPNYYAPITSQMIYPEAELTSIKDKKLKSLTFYLRDAAIFNGSYSLSLATTTESAFEYSATLLEGLTPVAVNHIAEAGVTEFVVNFDNTFEYTGGNLAIQLDINENGTPSDFNYQYCYGVNQNDYTSCYSYTYYGTPYCNGVTFLPKVTFAIEDAPVVEVMIGDANDDGEVNIADVTTLIDYLLGIEVPKFNAINANVYPDEEINIADVTALIDQLLGL